MTLFKRILEIKGKFIPQTYRFLHGWTSRDRESYYEWISIDTQLRYCSYNTLEEAKASLITKIHKV